jgi:hypothetical protein
LGCFGGGLTLPNRLTPQAFEKQDMPVSYCLFQDWGGQPANNSTLAELNDGYMPEVEATVF